MIWFILFLWCSAHQCILFLVRFLLDRHSIWFFERLNICLRVVIFGGRWECSWLCFFRLDLINNLELLLGLWWMRILLNSSVSMLEASESDILGFIFFNLLSLSWFLLICKNWVSGIIQWWLGCIFSWFWLVCNHACSRSKHGWLACRGVGCLTKHGLGFRYESSARVHKISRLIWRFWAKWTCSERANNFYLIGVFFLVCRSFCHWCLSLANAKSTRLRLSKKRSSWHILSLCNRFK